MSKYPVAEPHAVSKPELVEGGSDVPEPSTAEMSKNTIAPAKPRTFVQPRLEGELKQLGGSLSDDWNSLVANQTTDAMWMAGDTESRDRQVHAAVAATIGIDPKDELEGMMVAQLLAAHNAAMECYRRGMLIGQTFEGRRENLNQANKLSRTYTMLLDALNKYRGKSHQKVTVEHVHVHAGGQAVVGNIEHPGGGDHRKE